MVIVFVFIGLVKILDGIDLVKYVVLGYEYNKIEVVKFFKEGLVELGLIKLKLIIIVDVDVFVVKNFVDYIKFIWEVVFLGFIVEEKFVIFK